MRILITGVTGFAGPYLAEHIRCVEPSAELFGLVWGELESEVKQLLRPHVQLIPGDLTDPASVSEATKKARPDVVFHLAAASSVVDSWSEASTTFEVNALGTVNLFEAIRSLGIAPTTVVASSADVYGRAGNGPLTEDLPLEPVSPYGVSKAALELVAYQYYVSANIPTVRLRLFNHTGPRQPDRFVASSLTKQIVEIERRLRPPELSVGNLDVQRDFNDVRDIARAYWSAATLANPGTVYNVCSGTAVSIRELIDMLLTLIGASVEPVVDSTRVRDTDIPTLVGDRTRFTHDTGWQPEIPLRQTLADLLEWWRLKIGNRS